jgi:hypothetical protein
VGRPTREDAIVDRAAIDPLTKTAEGYFNDLRAAGGRVVLIPTGQLAELAAYQAMFTAAKVGDLTRAGKPVDAGEFSDWAKGHLTDPVRLFLVNVFGPLPQLGPVPASPPPPATAQTKKVPVKV